jgi:hypothetical protein
MATTDSGKMSYSDLISPDNSIEILIGQLEQLNKSYGTMVNAIRANAKEIVAAMKSMNSSTADSRAQLDDVAIAANRLERAQRELKIATSDTGKEIAWLKSQTASYNKMSAEQQRQSQSLINSYDRLKSELREQISLWKSLDQVNDKQFSEDLLADIVSTRNKISDLDEQLKVHVSQLSAVEKAEQKLNFLRSEEGQKLLNLKQKIAEIYNSHKAEKPAVDEVAAAYDKLQAAQSATRVQASQYNLQAKEANTIARLQAQLNTSAEGSYNALAAQYELNKIKLNAMSGTQRSATEAGKALVAETNAIYQQMIKLQEATGNHKLSVGNYSKSWDGLGVSISNVVRELPAAAVSMNTFFLGISNNIPIVIDEIKRLRVQNKQLAAEGKPTASVIKSVAAAMFSWNTLLVIGLTLLSSHGKEIISWIGSMFKGKESAISITEALSNINKELEKTSGSYGDNIVRVKKLASEWKNLSSKKEQLQWIKDNKSEFDQLNISVRNVADAENIFVENTEAVVAALRLRAKAAAAQKIASEHYEDALRKQMKAEREQYTFSKDPKTGKIKKVEKKDQISTSAADNIIASAATSGGGALEGDFRTGNQRIRDMKLQQDIAIAQRKKRIQGMYEEAKAAELNGDAYFELANGYNAAASAELKKYGIETKHNFKKETTRHGREPRDLTDRIWRNDLEIQKKYEASITALKRNEFEKQKNEAVDAVAATIREMQEKFRKNQAFLDNKDGKFKPLTQEQRDQIQKQQDEISAIIENTQKKLAIDLLNIDYERQAYSKSILRERIKWDIEAVSKSIEEEKQLRLRQIEEEDELYRKSLRASIVGKKGEGNNLDEVIVESLTAEQLAASKQKKLAIEAKYNEMLYNLQKQRIDNELELAKKGSAEELKLLLEQLELERKIALAQNSQKPAAERQSDSDINAVYKNKAKLLSGNIALSNFDQAQSQAEAEYNIVKRNELQLTKFKLEQERDRWIKQIELAKSGALKWSDAQIKEAEAAVKGINRKLGEINDFASLIGKKGLVGAILTKLGFDDDQIAAFEDAVGIVLDNLAQIAQAEVDIAQAAVDAAEKRVDAAQKAYDAEVEGRNNGYANNVATAKKELQQEKRRQQEKEKLLAQAQRRQEAINTLTQASSLITASANIWQSMSSVPIVGPALAIAAIAAMWTSFAVAKVKAKQVAAASQEYGEGGLEFLEGGSHASGNDIDLHTKNKNGKSMRAEGGEALAVINKRRTRQYRKMLPDIIGSLNRGTFEDKYIKAFSSGEKLAQTVHIHESLDLSSIEANILELKKQNELKIVSMPDGSITMIRKNVTTHIK